MSERVDSRLREWYEKKKLAAQKTTEAKALSDAADRMELSIWAEMDDLRLPSMDVDFGAEGVRRFRKAKRQNPRIINEEALIKDLKERGLFDELTKPGARKKALNQYVKTLTEAGQPIPAGVDIHDTEYISDTSIKRRN